MNRKNKGVTTVQIALIIGIIIVAGVVGAYFLWPKPKTNMIVSTTTSFYETGFLDYLKKNFEQKNPGYNVSFTSQGTGQAIQTAKNGQADMILVHDPPSELTFLNQTYGVNRKVVAYNFFAVVGPTGDPAKTNGTTPLQAFKNIKAAGENGTAKFVSRGDNSGTNSKEKRLWAAAGINWTQIRSESWYLEAGQGMTATLNLANQENAYTLSDLASYLNNKQNIQLKLFVYGGVDLLNVYAAIPCNPQKIPSAKFDAAMLLTKYLVSDEGQNLFKNFGVDKYGDAIFKPWVAIAKTGTPADIYGMVKGYAFFQNQTTECPTQYRYNADDLYA